jgi:peptidoglycan hydrolase-like protein with peptidoglycan-binding domain
MSAGTSRSRPNLRLVRKAFLIAGLVAALAWATSARAAPPAVSVTASPDYGRAPLQVTLTAAGDAATYHWKLGDGSGADGAVVQHTYRHPGKYHAVVTATGVLTGEVAQASVKVTAYSLSLHTASPATYGRRLLFKGVLRPARAGNTVVLRRSGKTVGTARVGPAGRYRIRPLITKPGTFQVLSGQARSRFFTVRVRPILEASLAGTGVVHTRLAVVAKLRPAAAGTVRVRVFRNGRQLRMVEREGPVRVRLKTQHPQEYKVRVQVIPTAGYAATGQVLQASVFFPALGLGSAGSSVSLLQQRLRAQRYMLRGVTGHYGYDTYEAVLAFQKVHWLSRTGRVDARFWHVLLHSSVPAARYRGPGLHFEVDKSRQVLFDVSGGVVTRVIHVSTGATGNTPLGVWHVYSKTAGYNAKGMYDSLYFVGGFAIHGYADVPPYPASHGCVRIPIWIAPILYETHPYGTTVYIY